MDNRYLFTLINAGPGLDALHLGAATALARWSVYLLPILMAFAWGRGDDGARRELMHMVVAAVVALGIAQVVSHLWPQPRPFALHLGNQYLEHSDDPGLPSDHVTFIWSVALAALALKRYAVWGFPLLACGPAVGWSRVYLGIHFPFDVVAALPVAALGAAAAWLLRGPVAPMVAAILRLHERLIRLVGAVWRIALIRGRKG